MSPPAPMDRARALGYAAIALGLALIAAGLAWREVVPREAYWTAEDAREYEEAAAAAHAASIPGHSHDDADGPHAQDGASLPDADALAGAKERFQRAQDRLAAARTARNVTGRVLAAAGAVLAALGVLALRRTPAPRRSADG